MEGKLYWLPEENHIRKKHGSLALLQQPDTFEGTFKHPFLVVEYNERTNIVSGYCCTSFHDQPLQRRFKGPKLIKSRLGYMAIVPSDPHPDTGVLLRITNKNFKSRKRNSYVDVRFLRKLNFRVLEPFWNGEHVLDVTSMRALKVGAENARKLGYGTKSVVPPRIVVGMIPSYSACIGAPSERPAAAVQTLAHEITVPTTSRLPFNDADAAERGQVHPPYSAAALYEEDDGERDRTPLLPRARLPGVPPRASIPSPPNSPFERVVVSLLTVAAIAGVFGLCVLVWQIWP